DFTVMSQADANGLRPIRFGLCAVRGVGSKAVEAILATRDTDGPFRSLPEFCKRVLAARVDNGNGSSEVPPFEKGGSRGISAIRNGAADAKAEGPAQVNKKVIESLIKCGA